MFFPPLTKCLGMLVLLVATAVPAVASPTSVKFEPGFFDIFNNANVYQENGITVTPTGGDAVIDVSFCTLGSEFCAVGNNTSYLTALNDAQITVARTDGLAFDLLSFDASFFPSPFVNFSGEAVHLLLTGSLFGGGSVFQTFSLLEDVIPGDFLFGTYNSALMRQLSSVTFSACFFDGSSCSRDGNLLNLAQFALDNLSFDNPSSVPEPGMGFLMALCLGALAVTCRHSARS